MINPSIKQSLIISEAVMQYYGSFLNLMIIYREIKNAIIASEFYNTLRDTIKDTSHLTVF